MAASQEKSVFAAAMIIIIVVVALSIRFYDSYTSDGSSIRVEESVIILDKAACGAAGGSWNSCGSACRGQEDEGACIQVCVAQCECKVDDECPFGYSCKEMIDGVGICKGVDNENEI